MNFLSSSSQEKDPQQQQQPPPTSPQKQQKIADRSGTRRSLRDRLRDGTTSIGNFGRDAVVGVVGVGQKGVQGVVGVGQMGVQAVGAVGGVMKEGVGAVVGGVTRSGGGSAVDISTGSTAPSTAAAAAAQNIKSRSMDYTMTPPTAIDENYFQAEPPPPKERTKSSPIKQISIENKKYQIIRATPTDTLTSLAAKYETTPGELIKLNKLPGRLIFPGQELKVPEVKTFLDENVFMDAPLPQQKCKMERKFVKVKVRHVTDGNGVVSGTLLVTPNAVMFDPNVSDPLVIEQGAEMYGVILPIEVVCHAAVLSDIAGMKVEKGVVNNNENEELKVFGRVFEPVITEEKKSPSAKATPSKTLKRLSFPLTWMDSNSSNEDLSEGGNYKRSSAPPSAALFLDSAGGGSSKFDLTESGSSAGQEQPATSSSSSGGGGVGVVSGVLRRSFERLLPSSSSPPPPPPPQIQTDSSTSPKKTTVSAEPTPLEASPEWYLLLSTARPATPSTQKLPLIVSYGQKNYLRPEYWFHIVAREQVTELYEFWTQWFPETYSGRAPDLDLLARRSLTLTTFTNMDLNTSYYNQQQLQQQPTLLEPTMETNKESWEVVSMSEELRQALYGFNNEDLLFVEPETRGQSEIFEQEDLRAISRVLTPRAEGHPLTLLFTTSRDGFSLSTLFRRNADIPLDTPIILLIQETKGAMFGALLSQPLYPSETFYGTGQCFLFTLRPFRIFKWTGENLYFCKCGWQDGVVVGAGDGHFGIYLDSDLNCGRTDFCSTFNNPPLTVVSDDNEEEQDEPQEDESTNVAEAAAAGNIQGKDFVIKTLECWAFIDLQEQATLGNPPPLATATQINNKSTDDSENNENDFIFQADNFCQGE